jgi:hypothetical protein
MSSAEDAAFAAFNGNYQQFLAQYNRRSDQLTVSIARRGGDFDEETMNGDDNDNSDRDISRSHKNGYYVERSVSQSVSAYSRLCNCC